ncbi:MAG: arginine--tRNA ligase [Thermoproteus sp.]|nr:arginine--tRNA ligase [Thermoproteus sp.]
MDPLDPLDPVFAEFEDLLAELTARLGARARPDIDYPSRFGFISARLHRLKVDPAEVSRALADLGEFKYLSNVRLEGLYLNADVKPQPLADSLFSALKAAGEKYGVSGRCKYGKILIEHTSANPLHPLHVGHGRNAVLGDSLARLLRFCGGEVEVHFYVDDCGSQVMYAALGFAEVEQHVRGIIARGVKPDLAVGYVYSVATAVAEINRLKRAAEAASDEEKRREITAEIDEWLGVIKRHMDAEPELVGALIERLDGRDLAAEAAELNRLYERGDEGARAKVRAVVDMVLRGQRETLERLGISVDSWDYESELTVWSAKAAELVEELRRRWPDYVELREGALVFRADKFVEDLGLREELDLPRFIPPVTLTRSDGTTLYVTRDVAYALWQYQRGVDVAIRVISSEQTHEQAHVRIILYALGHREAAKRIIHYSYEMVNMPGMKMSARRGQYVPLDEILDEAAERSLQIVKERDKESAAAIAEKVAVGAVRYFYLSSSPRKPIDFKWNVVLNMRSNSGPFLQYTYVRAASILEKAGGMTEPAAPPQMAQEEAELAAKLAEWPRIVAKAAEDLRPDYVAGYLNDLAVLFNSYYEKYPVLKAEEPLRGFRLGLVDAVRIVMRNGLWILGIPVLQRM